MGDIINGLSKKPGQSDCKILSWSHSKSG